MSIRVIIVLMFLPLSIMAQQKDNDPILVTNTIENYFNGYMERDSKKLNAAFDIKNGTMKIPFKTKDGKEEYQNHYFKNIIPIWAARKKLSPEEKENCHLKILDIDIFNGKMATVKIEMKLLHATYIDMLSLQKMNEQWKITNKMYCEITSQ